MVSLDVHTTKMTEGVINTIFDKKSRVVLTTEINRHHFVSKAVVTTKGGVSVHYLAERSDLSNGEIAVAAEVTHKQLGSFIVELYKSITG